MDKKNLDLNNPVALGINTAHLPGHAEWYLACALLKIQIWKTESVVRLFEPHFILYIKIVGSNI